MPLYFFIDYFLDWFSNLIEMIIDGKKIAGEILEKLKSMEKPDKFLTVVSIGASEASKTFIKRKKEFAEKLGLDFREYEFPSDITNDKLRHEIGRISSQTVCGGLIVQLPLPEKLNRSYVLNAISPKKDLDCLGERSLGAFYNGRSAVKPPSVGVLEEILKIHNIKINETTFAVIGLGFLIGKPISVWLQGKAKEIILLDKGSDLEKLKDADIVISGAGAAKLFSVKQLKSGAGVIDFGISFEAGKIAGDFDAEGAEGKVLFYTPTPGGTGPILVAKLFENFYKLNQ